ncbi:hypothetical protein VTJ49DRAFT_619 [Mycothermus thermophilus]|uniref:Uncharacterized protein n=1 Tax=Humicola insolens TaxID=85995 RepID=A0ABR3VPD8_HUMIN
MRTDRLNDGVAPFAPDCVPKDPPGVSAAGSLGSSNEEPLNRSIGVGESSTNLASPFPSNKSWDIGPGQAVYDLNETSWRDVPWPTSPRQRNHTNSNRTGMSPSSLDRLGLLALLGCGSGILLCSIALISPCRALLPMTKQLEETLRWPPFYS